MHRPIRVSSAALCTAIVLSVCSCATSSTDKSTKVSPASDWPTKLEKVNLTETEFTECMAQMINQSGKRKARVAGVLKLTLGGFGEEEESSFYCVNAWKNCRNIPGERNEALKPYIASITTEADNALENEKPSLTDIVPVIRTNDYTQGITEKMEMYSEPFVSDLVVMYAIDTPESIRTMAAEKVRALNIEPAKLRKLAIDNLLRKFPEQKVQMGTNFSMLTIGGDYEASFLLCDYFWKDMAKRFGKCLVVGVPNRDILIFAAESNRKGVEQIRKLTKDGFAKNAYPISEKLLLYDGNWQIY
jgi:uncharacterized protein YtpQ (UPF0354 family)